MTQIFQASRQWERISENWVTEDAAVDLTNFKSDRRNYNISLWDPTANGIRYLKTLVYSLGMDLSPDDWVRVKRIQNREIGNPLTVRCNGESVCLDYLMAALELGFIEQEVDLQGGSVLEIGAGYGRTCHAILSNHDVSAYWILDLKNTLQLSKKYLREVLDDEQFAKMNFVQVENVDKIFEAKRFDLCINIHSFTEMAPETVRAYLDLIDHKCAAFYVKNPVGKFLDKAIDGHFKGNEAVQMALETGPLRQVLDIFDSQAVHAAVPTFVDAYRPGDDWNCAADGRARPWSYFWQAVYKNGSVHQH
jgi:putative sugar O-methyltransferase